MIKLYDPDIKNSDIESVLQSLKNKDLSGNTETVKTFENKLSKFLGIKYVSSCSSGTAALHLALLCTGIKKNDEVIMPNLSYIATANAVTYVGGVPVFVDIDPETWQIDVDKIEMCITKNTKAIMPVHLYGVVPELDRINRLAKKYNLKVIHDSAEALGSKYNKKYSTNFRNVSILSFFPNKIITTGEGGALCTNDKSIYEMSEKLKSQGLQGKKEYFHSDIGYNYRMSAMSAALGTPQIDRIERNIEKKKKLFDKYKFALEPSGFKFQDLSINSNSSYWLIACLVPEKISRNALKNYLYKNGIETRNVFIPLNEQLPYKHFYKKGVFPNSNLISSRGICLPSSPSLSNNDFQHIIKTIKGFI